MISLPELLNVATRLERAGRLADARNLYEKAIRAHARDALPWHQLGCIAVAQGHPEQAREYFVRAIRLEGNRPVFHHNLAGCCRMLGQLADARASYSQALRLDPENVTTRAHRCLTLYALGERVEADECARDTLRRPRTTPEAHFICATILLLRGEFDEGWAEHQWRLDMPPHGRKAPRETEWDGRPLDGRTILLYAEQGVGDLLQCLRYVPLVIERGGKPILAVQKSLMPLVADAQLCPLTPLEEPWPGFDFHSSVLSLPWALRTRRDSIPSEVPYLRACASLVEDWRPRLAESAAFRVGVHWQGNPAYQFDRSRSMRLMEFALLARVAGVRFVSLQKNAGVEQLSEVAGQFDVIDLGPDLDESHGAFRDTAAVMKHLDLVVTCDTATAHLAGALGVKVWVPLSTMADARWMLDRDDSPWYPTIRLFRQNTFGDWPGVFERMAAELHALVRARS